MENEIKVGDFIRTAQGTIAQIEEDEFEIKINIRGQLLYEKWIEDHRYYEVIVKHSSNLIDLIQCGDYVNGIRVKQWFKGVYTKGIELENGYKIDTVNSLGKIKTVVTKEMMESISYKVKE